MSCEHAKPRRIASAAEWCPACGAYRVEAAWQLPELARDVPGMHAQASAINALRDAAADSSYVADQAGDELDRENHAERSDRIERVAAWLENLPLSVL